MRGWSNTPPSRTNTNFPYLASAYGGHIWQWPDILQSRTTENSADRGYSGCNSCRGITIDDLMVKVWKQALSSRSRTDLIEALEPIATLDPATDLWKLLRRRKPHSTIHPFYIEDDLKAYVTYPQLGVTKIYGTIQANHGNFDLTLKQRDDFAGRCGKSEATEDVGDLGFDVFDVKFLVGYAKFRCRTTRKVKIARVVGGLVGGTGESRKSPAKEEEQEKQDAPEGGSWIEQHDEHVISTCCTQHHRVAPSV